ncbi:MAG: hypothetical protein IKM34_07840 [Clostridia bacterium]|nr:hypothetical protein [Clostridia bacterium]
MKKRSFLSILLVFVMIATVCLFVGCDEEETNAKIDDAVVEAVAQATEKIETAKAELTAAIAAKADPATLTAKAEELNAAIDAAKAAATTADAAVKTEIEAAITAATKAVADAAATNLETAKTELTAAIANKADAATLTAKADELTAAIETAKTAATTAATAADATLKAEIEAAITTATKAVADTAAANLEAAKGELNALIANKADASAVTDAVSELVKQIATAQKAAVDTAATAATGADAALKADIEAAIKALKAELADADAAIESAYIAIDAWNEATEEVIDMLIELELAYIDVIANSGDLKDVVEDDLLAIYTDTKVRLYRAYSVDAANEAYDYALAVFEGVVVLEGAFEEYTGDHYYDVQLDAMADLWNKAFEDLMNVEFTTGIDIDAINNIAGDLVDDLADVKTKAELLMDALTTEGSTVADVVKNEAWAEVLTSVATDLGAESDELKADWEALADVVELYEDLAARYDALTTAYFEADLLNGQVAELVADLEAMNVIRVAYQDDYIAITAAVKTWIETYFTDFAKEGENYNVLDHDAIAAYKELYDEKVGQFVEAAIATDAAIDAIGTVTIRSEQAIDAAYDRYLEFTDLLATLEFMYEDFQVRPTEVMLQEIGDAYDKFDAICVAAEAAYEELVKLDTTTVTIYSGADVNALVEWYETYLGVDVLDAESVIGTEGLIVTEDDLAAAKALVAAYDELVEAKNAETAAVIEMIGEIYAALSQREAADAAQAAWSAWLHGDNAPEGYTADQFAADEGDDTYVVTNYSELKTIRRTITDLEKEFAELSTKFDLLNKVETDLVDETVRADYADYVAMVEVHVADFVTRNANEDPFTADQYDLFDLAQIEIAQGAAIQNVTELRYNPIANTVALIADERVSKDIIARADAALAVAIDQIKAIESTDPADFEVPTQALELIEWTAVCYVNNFIEGKANNFYIAYTALRDSQSDRTFEQELAFITETFENAVA